MYTILMKKLDIYCVLSRIWNTMMFFLLDYTWTLKPKEILRMKKFYKYYKHIEFRKTDKNVVKNTETIVLKIVTWNIHKGYDITNSFRLLEVMRYLETKSFDIVCLQEMNNITYDIDGIEYNLTGFIADKLNYYAYFCKDNTILSKYKIVLENFEQFYTCKYSYGNYNQYAKIIIGGKIVNLFNFHLNCDITGVEQIRFLTSNETKNIVSEINNEKLPIIVCGDFNSASWYNGVKNLRRLLGYPENYKHITYMPTFPTIIPIFQLDKIYTNENIQKDIKIKKCEIDYTVSYSDHFPLTAEIEIKLT